MSHAVLGKEGNKQPLIDQIKHNLVSRAVKKVIPQHLEKTNLTLVDVGCGYEASFLQSLQNYYGHGIGIDFEIAKELRERERGTTTTKAFFF